MPDWNWPTWAVRARPYDWAFDDALPADGEVLPTWIGVYPWLARRAA